MIKAVIYDFDDIIVDSDSLHLESWEQALKEFNVKPFDDFKRWRAEKLIGRSSLDNARIIVDHYQIKTDPKMFYQKKVDIFMQIAADKLQLLPGVLDSIKLFKKEGLKLAIATGSHRKYLESVLERFNLAQYFDILITSDEITKSKPDPQPYLAACEKLGLSPSECLAIEDAEVGVQSAKGAGCKCIAIPSKGVVNQDYSEADLVLKSLAEITKNDIISLNHE